MTHYNQTIAYKAYQKILMDEIDKNFPKFLELDEGQREQEFQRMVVEHNFYYNAWINASANEMEIDSITAKINKEYIVFAAKYFDTKIVSLLKAYEAKIHPKAVPDLSKLYNNVYTGIENGISRPPRPDDWLTLGQQE